LALSRGLGQPIDHTDAAIAQRIDPMHPFAVIVSLDLKVFRGSITCWCTVRREREPLWVVLRHWRMVISGSH
jgi:hypothetical protein